MLLHLGHKSSNPAARLQAQRLTARTGGAATTTLRPELERSAQTLAPPQPHDLTAHPYGMRRLRLVTRVLPTRRQWVQWKLKRLHREATAASVERLESAVGSSTVALAAHSFAVGGLLVKNTPNPAHQGSDHRQGPHSLPRRQGSRRRVKTNPDGGVRPTHFVSFLPA